MTALRLFRSMPRSADTDAELLARFVASRDEGAFAELLNRHGPLVYRVCRRLLDVSLADDAFQASFLVLATRADRVRKAASVGSWLVGVAGRVARQMRRRGRWHPARLDSDSVAPASEPVLHTADLGRVLDEELTRLPDKLRSVVVACLIEDRTQADAAKALGESERTIRRRVAQAKQLLRERLERRGVVPAVAGGLIAGVGTATAVPPRLADSTLSVAFDFLAGGAAVASVPATLAKGVAMSGLRMKVAASVAVFALGLSALGVGLADDKPKPSEPPTIPPQQLPGAPVLRAAPPPPADAEPRFVVTGGDTLVNRIVQREAEHQARVLAEKWTGKPLPPLKDNWKIVVKIEPSRTVGSTTFTYGPDKTKPALLASEMQLEGSLEQILRVQLPHEITHCVLAAHFGRPLPRWADEGIALLSEPAKEQADHDIKCREVLNGGKALVLKTLLPMTEYPKDLVVLYAQGHSVARFLHARDAKKLLPLLEASFADGWDKALKATYGFADADELEKAWIEWLKKPETLLKAIVKPAAKVPGDYVIEAPDILKITFAPKPEAIPKDEDQYLVRPDGTINLGAYGTVAVAGMTLTEATDAVRKAMKKFRVEGEVTLDVSAFSSKHYYVITNFAVSGEQVQRFPLTGNETVLDAIATIGGVKPDAKCSIWVARQGANGGAEQTLPVDWKGITEKGVTKTNYQLLPGDRVYVMPK